MALSSRLSLEERPIEIAPAIENHASKHRLGDKVWITVAAGPTVLKVALTLCEGDKGGGGGCGWRVWRGGGVRVWRGRGWMKWWREGEERWSEGVERCRSEGVER